MTPKSRSRVSNKPPAKPPDQVTKGNRSPRPRSLPRHPNKMSSQSTLESRVRRKAGRYGYRVLKSCQRTNILNLDNVREYMLLDAQTGGSVFGFEFDASLEEIEAWLDE